MPNPKESHAEGSYDGLLNSAKIRAHVETLKGEVEELFRLVGCGSVAESKMLYYYKYGVGCG